MRQPRVIPLSISKIVDPSILCVLEDSTVVLVKNHARLVCFRAAAGDVFVEYSGAQDVADYALAFVPDVLLAVEHRPTFEETAEPVPGLDT